MADWFTIEKIDNATFAIRNYMEKPPTKRNALFDGCHSDELCHWAYLEIMVLGRNPPCLISAGSYGRSTVISSKFCEE